MSYPSWYEWRLDTSRFRASLHRGEYGKDLNIGNIKIILLLIIFAISNKSIVDFNNKILNKEAIYETLLSFKRAGANAIISYYADHLDKILK